jgi:2-oxoglutarate dehydrogenase E1 component
VVWAQEEPKNNGYWFFVEPFIEDASPMPARRSARPLCRPRAAAAVATGLMKRHQAEQGALVADALGHNVREEIRRTRNQ